MHRNFLTGDTGPKRWSICSITAATKSAIRADPKEPDLPGPLVGRDPPALHPQLQAWTGPEPASRRQVRNSAGNRVNFLICAVLTRVNPPGSDALFMRPRASATPGISTLPSRGPETFRARKQG